MATDEKSYNGSREDNIRWWEILKIIAFVPIMIPIMIGVVVCDDICTFKGYHDK